MKKTQKSFKKKALLSSVSMLMVATVAVGSATFAWFKTNPNANAEGLSLKATASNGLVIMTETHFKALQAANAQYEKKIDDFVTTDYLYYDADKLTAASGPKTKGSAFTLTPASLDLQKIEAAGENPGKSGVGNAYTTLAASNSSSTADNDKPVTTVGKGYNGEAVYKESIFCALSGATSASDKITLNLERLTVNFNSAASALKNSLRVVLAYQLDGGDEVIFGQYALGEEDPDSQLVGKRTNKMLLNSITSGKKYGELAPSDTTDVEFDQLTLDNTIGAYAYKFEPVGAAKAMTTQLGTSGNDKVNVYIYLDGEDEDCFSQRINANNIVDSINVELSIPVTD